MRYGRVLALVRVEQREGPQVDGWAQHGKWWWVPLPLQDRIIIIVQKARPVLLHEARQEQARR